MVKKYLEVHCFSKQGPFWHDILLEFWISDYHNVHTTIGTGDLKKCVRDKEESKYVRNYFPRISGLILMSISFSQSALIYVTNTFSQIRINKCYFVRWQKCLRIIQFTFKVDYQILFYFSKICWWPKFYLTYLVFSERMSVHR